ncbi:MAG: DUF2973 domain-containing protein [Cyanobacteria bacterium SBLK]|nr:DUF2973 domain-containing protein [Cyanobacteria bacterium SBLK]
MLHLLYILAFTAVAILAIANLVRSLLTLGQEANRHVRNREEQERSIPQVISPRATIPHPELLDGNGQPISEPLLVMRSVDVEEAREKLDALYRSSPGVNDSDR